METTWMAQLLHPANWSIKIHGNKLWEYMTHAQWCSIVKVRLILSYLWGGAWSLNLQQQKCNNEAKDAYKQ